MDTQIVTTNIYVRRYATIQNNYLSFIFYTSRNWGTLCGNGHFGYRIMVGETERYFLHYITFVPLFKIHQSTIYSSVSRPQYVPLFSLSILTLILVLPFPDYCFELRKCKSPKFVVLFQNCVGYSTFFAFPCEFRISFFVCFLQKHC